MLNVFERHYTRFIFYGLLILIWFAAFFNAAYDLWAATVFFAAITLFAVLFLAGRACDKKPIRAPLSLPWVFLLLTLAFSARHSYDIDSTWLEFWGWFFSALYFYLLLNVLGDVGDRDHFLSLAGAVLLPLAGIALWQQATSQPIGYGVHEIRVPGLSPWNIRYGHWEIHATLVNSVVFAGFVLYWLPYYIVQARKSRTSSLFILAGLICLVLSRSVWAFFVLGFGLALYYHKTIERQARAHPKNTAVLIFLVVITSALLMSLKLHHRPVGSSGTPSYHMGTRRQYWAAAVRMWEHSPGTGIGLGAYATAYPYFRTSAVENTRFAHSFPLEILAETGTWGVVALGFLLLSIVNMRKRDETSAADPTLSIYDVTLIMILIYSMISIPMDYLVNQLCLFIFVAAALSSRPASEECSIPTLWIAAAGACLLLSSAFWLPMLPASQRYISGLFYEKQGDFATAEMLYHDAVALDPNLADGYGQLAQLYRGRYQKDHRPADLAMAREYLARALRCRKDVRFVREMALLDTLS